MTTRFATRAGLIALVVVVAALAVGVPIVGAQARVCPPGTVLVGKVCVPVEETDTRLECGPNPYRFNDIGGHWERRFIIWCFDATPNPTRDPFDVIFDGMDYGEVMVKLDELGLGGMTHDEQVAVLIEMGYWSEEDAYVPDGAPKIMKGTG